MLNWKTALAVVLAGLMVATAGCSKLTRKNYDKINNGMTLGQVEKVLGKTESGGPVADLPSMPEATEVMVWEEKAKGKTAVKSISVGLKDGRVVGKIAAGL
jgi:hypothetical protein